MDRICGTCNIFIERYYCHVCKKSLHDDPKCFTKCIWCDEEFCINHYAEHTPCCNTLSKKFV